MTSEEALVKLGQSTAEAVTRVLEQFCPGAVHVGEVTIVPAERHPLEGVGVPAVGASIAYVDGVSGGNVFVMSLAGARRLAAAMMGQEAPEADEQAELDELELSAVAEAMNQMMAAAAAATSAVLGYEVEISPPETRVLASSQEAVEAYQPSAFTTSTSFNVLGEPSRFVQLVPNSFTVRMTTALDELGAEYATASSPGASAPPAGEGAGMVASLRDIPVRVWAELGRARMPTGQVVGLPPGAIVELDRQVDEPVDLYVNGMPFATGRLVVVDGNDWAVRIEKVHRPDPDNEPDSERGVG